MQFVSWDRESNGIEQAMQIQLCSNFWVSVLEDKFHLSEVIFFGLKVKFLVMKSWPLEVVADFCLF